MIATLTQHIPNAARDPHDVLQKWEFSSVEELLELEWVKKFKRGNFYQFSMSDNHLMVEYKEGYEWWVVGRIDNLEVVKDLPEWKPK